MYFSNYILYILYIPVCFFYLKYIKISTHRNIFKESIGYFNKLFLILLIASLFAILNAEYSNLFLSPSFNDDISRFIYFLLIFIIPFDFSDFFSKIRRGYMKVFHLFLFVFVSAVGYSLFATGLGNSAFAGNILGATTINLTIVSSIAFYALFMFYLHRKYFFIVLTMLSWLVCLASLSKWNFIVDVAIPVLLYKVWFSNKEKRNPIKYVQLIFVIAVLSIFLLPNLKNYLNNFASLSNYGSFDEYLSGKVFDQVTPGSESLIIGSDKTLADGYRFPMWNDLISRTLKVPLLGLGFGVRAFDYEGLNVEDHNIFITIFSRFGFVFGLLILYFLYKTIKSEYKFCKNDKFTLTKYFFLLIMGNFFFQASVGMIWGQLPVTLLLGLMLTIIFSEITKIKPS